MADTNTIVICSAMRTAIGHYLGAFQAIPAPQLGAHAIKASINAGKINHHTIDQVIIGCVLTAGQRQAPARQAAYYAGLPNNIPCTTINKMCGSGLASIMQAHDHLACGRGQIIVAGGMENMSQAPYLSPATRQGARLGGTALLDHLMHDGLENAYDEHQPMGYFAEACANEFNISREMQDQFTMESIKRAQQATDTGLFMNEITPVVVQQRRKTIEMIHDEGLHHVDVKKIQSLKPVFQLDGTVTAANASNLSDGAAAVVMMRESTAVQHGYTPLAYIQGISTQAQSPEQFTTAPIGAIQRLLDQLNWTTESIDCFEINEAFSVVPLVVMQALNIPRDKVNVHGGACVLGHPIGASGTRIVTTLIHALHARKQRRGIATACIGGGEAIAIAIETH
ncbi:MAG: acetyl-CoA C-acyltransferase [Coxiellaceae bacterium]|nr:acetyl-CoA C-acyltransferase [Coxiellaceae bacterium]